eukprot:CAMPEP_0119351686 /NCGR_PEP_ID=MMETSP1334-20130426/995_1 /TAXON_ID=127549 /ORGANISM="Calcidiscus leptoporus, Strain RCC1130" /LENGTH=501 /DNA_ID=CAMNT_0007364543 /DNA_START=208 /DNA_END=1713 /DNA_ORIENTATION=-
MDKSAEEPAAPSDSAHHTARLLATPPLVIATLLANAALSDTSAQMAKASLPPDAHRQLRTDLPSDAVLVSPSSDQLNVKSLEKCAQSHPDPGAFAKLLEQDDARAKDAIRYQTRSSDIERQWTRKEDQEAALRMCSTQSCKASFAEIAMREVAAVGDLPAPISVFIKNADWFSYIDCTCNQATTKAMMLYELAEYSGEHCLTNLTTSRCEVVDQMHTSQLIITLAVFLPYLILIAAAQVNTRVSAKLCGVADSCAKRGWQTTGALALAAVFFGLVFYVVALTPGDALVCTDRYLDQAPTGPVIRMLGLTTHRKLLYGALWAGGGVGCLAAAFILWQPLPYAFRRSDSSRIPAKRAYLNALCINLLFIVFAAIGLWPGTHLVSLRTQMILLFAAIGINRWIILGKISDGILRGSWTAIIGRCCARTSSADGLIAGRADNSSSIEVHASMQAAQPTQTAQPAQVAQGCMAPIPMVVGLAAESAQPTHVFVAPSANSATSKPDE